MRSTFLVAGYLAIYALALAWLVSRGTTAAVEPLFILAIFGALMPLLAWLFTRGAAPLPIESGPAAPAIVYLVVVAAFATWGLGALPQRQPLHDIASIAAKLVVMVVVPMLLFRTRLSFRFTRRDAAISLVFGVAFCALQLVAGSGPRRIAALHLSGAGLAIAATGALLWYSVEAGLVEEYFFRAVLQTRLERALRSPAAGIIVAALLFGLVHAPGIFLRTARTHEALVHPSLLTTIAYTIVILSPTGIGFGVLWTRTRNLLVLALVHGAGDLIPNLADFASGFGIR